MSGHVIGPQGLALRHMPGYPLVDHISVLAAVEDVLTRMLCLNGCVFVWLDVCMAVALALEWLKMT
jgi:hypothetical protein